MASLDSRVIWIASTLTALTFGVARYADLVVIYPWLVLHHIPEEAAFLAYGVCFSQVFRALQYSSFKSWLVMIGLYVVNLMYGGYLLKMPLPLITVQTIISQKAQTTCP